MLLHEYNDYLSMLSIYFNYHDNSLHDLLIVNNKLCKY